MFGYVVINKPEIKFKDYDVYRSYYCGLCRQLNEKYGRIGQATLSFDMTFTALLLTSLYEPETTHRICRCIVHPMHKHSETVSKYSAYAADMNILLTYYKCRDDWQDEHKYKRFIQSKMLEGSFKRLREKYPEKTDKIFAALNEIHRCEENDDQTVDGPANLWGKAMAEILTPENDEWTELLHRLGFYLGKFIYIMDAYEDRDDDLKNGRYNPLKRLGQEADYLQRCENILTMMMSECSRAFEQLPIVENTDILRNILYSGVWCKYELINAQKQKGNRKK